MIRHDLIAALIYALCIVGFLVAVRNTTLGQSSYDPGPGEGDAPYPFFDKHSLFHLAGCAVACLFALWIGVHWMLAVGLTVAGGVAYEAVNGNLAHRGSWYDVLWDTMGALIAVGLFGAALQAQDTTLAPPSDNAPASVILMWVVIGLAGLGLVLVARHFQKRAAAKRAATREQERYPVE